MKGRIEQAWYKSHEAFIEIQRPEDTLYQCPESNESNPLCRVLACSYTCYRSREDIHLSDPVLLRADLHPECDSIAFILTSIATAMQQTDIPYDSKTQPAA